MRDDYRGRFRVKYLMGHIKCYTTLSVGCGERSTPTQHHPSTLTRARDRYLQKNGRLCSSICSQPQPQPVASEVVVVPKCQRVRVLCARCDTALGILPDALLKEVCLPLQTDQHHKV